MAIAFLTRPVLKEEPVAATTKEPVAEKVWTPEEELKSLCFQKALKEFSEYRKAEGDENLKIKAFNSGFDWATYQKTMVVLMAEVCYEQNKKSLHTGG